MSSTQSTPSPRQGPIHIDDSQFPAGHCRYILLLPEIRGQRCACVNFTLNRATPGVACECGHLSCFHAKEPEPAVDMSELERVKRELEESRREQQETRLRMNQMSNDIGLLHEILGREQDREQEIVIRLSGMEDSIERNREEVNLEYKNCYRHVNVAFDSIKKMDESVKELDTRMTYHQSDFNNRIIDLEEKQDEFANDQAELRDENIELESRLDDLEREVRDRGRTPRQSISHTRPPPGGDSAPELSLAPPSDNPSATDPALVSTQATIPLRTAHHIAGPDEIWTVHISLLPDSVRGFPFERNTNAYKRCLSRGLHRMVVVHGFDHDAFTTAVTEAFGKLLQGRPWMPLRAAPCTAERLAGLPMLRPLEPHLLDKPLDYDFLRQNCAVSDSAGKIDHLYIAMRHDTLSWLFIKKAPVYMEGLEACWDEDRYLDTLDGPFDDDDDSDGMTRPSAAEILPQKLKRAASEMSRSSSFSSVTGPGAGPAALTATSAGECEGSRPKVARTGAPLPNIVEIRRRAERV